MYNRPRALGPQYLSDLNGNGRIPLFSSCIFFFFGESKGFKWFFFLGQRQWLEFFVKFDPRLSKLESSGWILKEIGNQYGLHCVLSAIRHISDSRITKSSIQTQKKETKRTDIKIKIKI